MKKIVYFTDRNNGSFEDEDAHIIERLQKTSDVTVLHPLEYAAKPVDADLIVIRNIWPTHVYEAEWRAIQNYIKERKIPTYNSLLGNGDNKGKDYLVELFKKGYPVIPSISDISELDLLGDRKLFWIKPKDGCDGSGSEILTRQELVSRNPKGYIIQPYVSFTEEPSFFFIDDTFTYGITTPNRLKDADITSFNPTEEDLRFAKKFVDWNKLPHGIQRVDAVRTKDGKLLLTEVEDIAPYLYLWDIDEKERERVIREFVLSLKKVIGA